MQGFEPGLARHTSLVTKLKEFQRNPSSLVFASLAEEYRKLGFAAQALEILDEGLFFHKDLPAALLIKARALADLKRFADALALLQHLLRKSPEHIRALQLQADIFLHLGQRQNALQCLRKVLFLFPGDKETEARIAEISRLLAGTRVVEATVSEAALPEESTGSISDFQVSRLSSFDSSEAGWEEAAPELSRQNTPIATRTIAELYIRQGLRQKAVDVLKRILHDDPQSTWAYDTLQNLQANSPFPSSANKVVFDHKTILNRKAQFLGRALAKFQLGAGSRESF